MGSVDGDNVMTGQLTPCDIEADVEALKLPSPLYSAVIVWLPTESDDVLTLAVPPLSATAVPIGDPLSLNCTVPVGVLPPRAAAVTVAVNVTDCPKIDGFGAPLTVVVVFPLFTVWVCNGDVLVVKFRSPLYTAVMTCGLPDVDKVEVVNVACPEAFKTADPIAVAPSMNVTLPVGTPPSGGTALTVAVKVTGCPSPASLSSGWMAMLGAPLLVKVTRNTPPGWPVVSKFGRAR